MRRRIDTWLTAFFCTALLWCGSNAWCAAAPDAAADGDAPPADVREQTIYVPYDKLWETFEKDGRGVFLPYEQFMELWNRARSKLPPLPGGTPPPVDSFISSVTGTIDVAEDVATMTASLRLEVFKNGWCRVPLRLSDVAITDASVGGENARLIRDADGHALLVEHRQDEPTEYDLSLTFVKAFEKTPGRNRLSFEAPLAPVSHWDIRIPEPGVKVDVQGALAIKNDVPDADAQTTHIRAFVGASPRVLVQWTPKAEGAKGMKPLVTVRATQQVIFEAGVVRCRATLEHEISRAPLTELAVDVPAGYRVVNVFDQNVKEWSANASGDKQRIEVQLFEPARGTQSLLVELESFEAEGTVAVPLVQAVDAGRQQGVVVVKAAEGLKLDVAERSGLLQIDTGDLPGPLERDTWDFAYRYAAIPFTLRVQVQKVRPEVTVESRTDLRITPEQTAIDYVAVLDIKRAGIFQISVEVPAEYEIRRVSGVEAGDAASVSIENHQMQSAGGAARILLVNLSRKAEGRVALAVSLSRTVSDPRLLTPGKEPVTVAADLPRISPADIERENGRLIVFAPESLRLTPTKDSGMRSVPPAQAMDDIRAPEARTPGRPVLAYAFRSHENRPSIALAVERRAPHVTVRQFLQAEVESGAVTYDATLFVTVLYSGIESFALAVPAEEADAIRIQTPGIRRTAAPVEGALPTPENTVLWDLRTDGEFLGEHAIRLRWEKRIDKLDVGADVVLTVPRLTPVGIDRAWGQIVLVKSETIDVAAETSRGLRPIDPRHDLMPGTAAPDAARAFEFHDEWELTIRATRYKTESVKATSIERALVRMVCTRGDVISVQAVYNMRSVRQRLTIELPPDVTFDTQPLRLDGRPTSLEKDDRGRYFVPLTAQRHGQTFLLELRYLVPADSLNLILPAFPEEPAVQRVYLSVYLPEERWYLGSSGPWNPEFVWVVQGQSLRPRGSRPDGSLIQWVTEDTSVDPGALQSFATDGQHLLFSTLRPPTGPQGGLKLTTAAGWVIKGAVLSLVVLLGLALLNASFRVRALTVGVCLIIYTLVAVFLPPLAGAVVSSASLGAAFVVFVIWVLWYVLVTRPRRTQPPSQPAPPARSTPTPTQEPIRGTTPQPDAGKPAEPASSEISQPDSTPTPAPPPRNDNTTGPAPETGGRKGGEHDE